jgi:hypothetical protein
MCGKRTCQGSGMGLCVKPRAQKNTCGLKSHALRLAVLGGDCGNLSLCGSACPKVSTYGNEIAT